ncbi:MAG: gamma-glutamyl-gamma-aminobutyrate hydrolase family protein [Trueperaceae bacterium]
MKKPRVGITVHVAEVEAREGHPEWRYQVGARYAEVVAQAGGVPLLLPTHALAAAETADVLDSVDALLVSGGGSIPGQYFVDNPDPSLRDTNPVRYDFEVELIRGAWVRGMPLLGICRGHQTIAEALGGGPVLNLGVVPGAREHYQTAVPTETTHDATFEAGTRLAGWVGSSGRINSFHRQVVQSPPAGWRVSAYSDDGWVEAMEAEDGFGVGVQYHPEWLVGVQPAYRALFAEFVAAALVTPQHAR